MTTISEAELAFRLSSLEGRHPWFRERYATPTCCPGHLIDYDKWTRSEVEDWGEYVSLRWLRGDEYAYEVTDD